MIDYTIFARSNIIFSDQNACLLSYNVMELGLVKILLYKCDRANKYVFLLDNMISDRPFKSPWFQKITFNENSVEMKNDNFNVARAI